MSTTREHPDGPPRTPLSSGGMIVREKEPVNLEMPFEVDLR